MTTSIQDILARYPKAVEAVERAYPRLTHWNAATKANAIRSYAANLDIPNAYIESLDAVLSDIDRRRLAETAPLTDEEIEGMKWLKYGDCAIDHKDIVSGGALAYCKESRDFLVKAQHACVDRLHAEIRRLRKEKA